MPENIFEYAVENKLRFPYKGMISVEDLYDLNTNELDSIYKTLKREMKKESEESLLETKSKEDVALSTKIEIIKAIVAKKLKKIAERNQEIANREKKNQILEILAKKQNESLHAKSEEELMKMLDDLG